MVKGALSGTGLLNFGILSKIFYLKTCLVSKKKKKNFAKDEIMRYLIP